MSALIQVLNTTRRVATPEWLTPTQRECHDWILGRVAVRSPGIVLGPAGCGKTFIAWMVQQESNLPLAGSLVEIDAGTGIVLLDNADLGSVNARETLNIAMTRGYTSAVLFGRALNEQGIPSFYLGIPTLEEARMVKDRLGLPSSTQTYHGNLWRVLREALHMAEWGEHESG